MEKNNPQKILLKSDTRVGYNAMLLAMTRNIEDENSVKRFLDENGIHYVVTEVGGNTSGSFQEKLLKATMGAALNAGLITKEPHRLHAVIHALQEAKEGVMMNMTCFANLAMKVAIVRDEHWIAVALFGESAIHPSTGHERCGMGIMHI